MATATMTSKGQITIPAPIRKKLRLEAGDRVDFIEVDDGHFELVAATRSIKELEGLFAHKATRSVSIEEMNEAIALAACESMERCR